MPTVSDRIRRVIRKRDMYLCYIDETGNRDPRLKIPQRDGTEQKW